MPDRPAVTDRRWTSLQIAGLGMVAIWLFLAGVVGAVKVRNDDETLAAAGGFQPDQSGLDLPGSGIGTTGSADGGTGPDAVVTSLPGLDGSTGTAPGDTGAAGGGPGTGTAGAGGGTGGTTGGTGGGTGGTGGGGGTQTGGEGDRTGVTDTEILIGVHAPITVGGAPLGLADDVIQGMEGYERYINEHGGIHGRMLRITVEDDRYETAGGADAARRLIEAGNFILSGTLGVDQVNVVANEAAKAGIPYHAAGGGEVSFGQLGVYQLSTSYDTHMVQLARFLSQDESYRGRRVGITALNSNLMKPSVEVFQAEAARVGVQVVETVFVEKPTEQSSYTAEIQRLKDAGVEVLVPVQDPITTSRFVNECQAALCNWRYTFSNFAHDGDTALTLMAGEWGRQQVRGLSAGCYYLHQNAYNPALCGHMDRAHAQWVEVYGEDEWVANGQGGAAGYQIVSVFAEALRRAGPDPTRERYAAAIRTFDRFDDLVTSPITFAGRSTFSHGADMMVVYEAQTNDKYKQITPGFVQF